jgi:Flp pilus assembly protein TadG
MKRALGRRGLLPLGVLALTIALAAVAALSRAADAGGESATRGSTNASTSCDLGQNISHVINIVFDNVHFARDNPNVPSDLELMPHLMSFLKSNGTIFSNTHTPLIAHTADDSLSIYTGLYGDRHGQPVSNSYKTYNADGSTDPATSFTYWTSPVVDTKNPPTAGHDATPSMVYSDTVPAKSGDTSKITPAPWVPFTRAGCNVGDFSTANMVLENAKGDLPTVFGADSPEVAQFNADADPFKDVEIADYIGEAVHCAQGAALCTDAQAVKFGQTTPSASAAPDLLPTEPGGYDDYQGLFGARYVNPQIGAGTPNLVHNGYQVTDAEGNLVDLDGNEIQEPFSHHPGFPGFNPVASQSLAVLADMQEAGIPVTYGYISDLHERKADTRFGCTTDNSTSAGRPLGPGDSCYVTNAQHYDAAFQKFFDRLEKDGITPANTLFVISAEENDQFAGANALRASKPTPLGCDGATVDNTALTVTPDVACNYAGSPNSQIGELQANIGALLANTSSKDTQFDIEPQGAAIYVHGQPAANDPAVRQLERDTAAMTNPLDPYSGVANEKITQYQAGALEQRVLHLQTADPLRTPTYTLFPKPDYFFAQSSATPAVSNNSNFAYDHGYYSPNIDITWVGMVGPGVANNQVDGPSPAAGNQPTDPESTKTVPQASQTGTWVEETDIRPTMLKLLGLTDDYQSDGHVITQALTTVPAALAATADLAKGYDQINSSVGQFATDTLLADSKALASGSASDDSAYAAEQETLQQLADDRDQAAAKIKQTLSAAAAGHMPNHGEIQSGLAHVKELLKRAHTLASQ